MEHPGDISFGSSLTFKFNKESDTDILDSFYENSQYSLLEFTEIKLNLRKFMEEMLI